MYYFFNIFTGCIVLSLLCITPTCYGFNCYFENGYNGYSEDYIKLKTGKKQVGQIKNWKNNISLSQLRRGDVAIFRRLNHAAIVSYVHKNKHGKVVYIKIKEWNYGTKWVDYACKITNKFGKTTFRKIHPQQVDGGFWRP